jgi:signal transduction histidine kinase
MNQAAEKMLGRRFAEIQGKLVFDTIPLLEEEGTPVPIEKRPLHIALTGNTTATDPTTESTYYYMCRGGKKFPSAIKASPIFLDNEIIGTVEVFRDITHEIEIDQAKSEFVSLASHQLRTPLGITKWYLEVLQKHNYINSAPKTIRDYFNQLIKSNERVLSLVSELLSVSRIEEGRVKNDPKPINIGEKVYDIVSEIQPLAQNKNIELRTELKQAKMPDMFIDPLRFHEVIENLLTNAIEYTPSSGKVYVIIDKSDDAVLISVKDTGVGISKEDQNKLFTKFFRSQNATERNPEGSGLGLYVAKSYVEGWGGKISVESRKGKGTTFLISLPLRRAKNGGEDS